MTDLPHDPLDELASAHLDGLTSPDEARRIGSDPALLQRVALLRAARDAVRVGDGPVDPARREAAIAAALAAAVEDTGSDLASLDDARRRRRARTWIGVVGAAAAVALAVVALPQLTEDDTDDGTTLAAGEAPDKSSAPVESAPSAGSGTDSVRDDSAAADSSATDLGRGDTTTVPSTGGDATAPAVVDLGSVADLDGLAAAVASELDAPAAPVATPAPDPTERDACLSTVRAGDQVLAAVARVGDQDVVVTVTAAPDDTRTLRVYAVGGCTLVDTRAT